jgi:acetyl esterase/lipase
MIGQELVVFPLGKVGFAARAMQYRRRYCTVVPLNEGGGVEVYSEGGIPGGPIVLFVHGGSWGQGAPWQYALLARRLLEAGALRVGIVRYRLFPEGDVHSMVSDVGAALDWAYKERSAEPMPCEVVIAGHSAGAHLCSLHLSRAALRDGGAGQLPDRFVALSGVFDIAPHFAHERTRGVHWLSPMWLAMMGRGVALPSNGSAAEDVDDQEHPQGVLEELAREASRGAPVGDEWSASELRAWARASPTRILLAAQAAAAHRWPPTTVLHAEDDGTVPVRSAREFMHALRRAAGKKADAHTYEVFGRGGHGEVMVALAGHQPVAALEPHVAELASFFLSSVVQPGRGGREVQAEEVLCP